MPTGSHFTTRAHAEAHLAANDWTEIAVNTWRSPDGDYTASFTDFCGAVVQVQVRGAV